jgi:hypothetical protein
VICTGSVSTYPFIQFEGGDSGMEEEEFIHEFIHKPIPGFFVRKLLKWILW